MSDADLGGDPPCWAHLLDDEQADDEPSPDCGSLVIDLGASPSMLSGAVWSLPHGGDLDANLIHLDPGADIGSHINDEVDVLLFVQSGSGVLTIDDKVSGLAADHLALIPNGSRRSIVAGDGGITYLSVHRRRSRLGVKRRPGEVQAS